MRRFNKSKKAAILASVLGSSLFVSSAFAANLLITLQQYGGHHRLSRD